MFDLFGIYDGGSGQPTLIGEVQPASHAGGQISPDIAAGPQGAGVPTSTLVGRPGGLQIDLLWDASVTSNPHWQAIESDVIAAAKMFTSVFTNPIVLNIAVGFGEVDGIPLAPSDGGESLTNAAVGLDLPTVEALLAGADAGLVHAGVIAPDAFNALDNVAGANTFVPTAELKAFGLSALLPPGLIDGFIGLSSSALALVGNIGPTQVDAVGAAAHEISEVMGRIGLEGQTLGPAPFTDLFTPFDMFRYSAPGVPDLTPSAGYFSLNDGVTALNLFNDPGAGGDAGDWATTPGNRLDAFDAFATPGVKLQVTAVDYLSLAALGYQLPGLS